MCAFRLVELERPGERVEHGLRDAGGDARFPSPTKLAGYTGLCPRVYQSGDSDRRGPLSKNGPRYLRWALIEATSHASHRQFWQHNRFPRWSL